MGREYKEDFVVEEIRTHFIPVYERWQKTVVTASPGIQYGSPSP